MFRFLTFVILANIVTVHNKVVKVMFLHVCVCPQRGEYLGRCPPGPGAPPRTRYTPGPGTPRTRYTPQTRYTPWDQVSPRTRYTPQDQVHPPGPGTPPLGPGTPPRRLLLRTVRILLECILVTRLCSHLTIPITIRKIDNSCLCRFKFACQAV